LLNNEHVIVSVSGKKVDLDNSHLNNLPPEAAALLANMKSTAVQQVLPPEAAALLANMQSQSFKNTSSQPSSSLPPEAAALFSQMQVQKEPKGKETATGKIPDEVAHLLEDIQKAQLKSKVSETSRDLSPIISDLPPNVGSALVRSRSKELEELLQKRDALEEIKNTQNQDPSKKFIIHESGVALGITLGQTTQKEAEEIMKNYSKLGNQDEGNSSMAFYPDITVTLLYNEDMLVREMVFGNKYKGETLKGLKSGDSVERAIEIYGQPRMKTARGAIWNKFGIFSQSGYVESIRIQF
jgi:hypothetical protein